MALNSADSTGTGHVLRNDQSVELLAGEVAELDGRIAQRALVLVRMLGDGRTMLLVSHNENDLRRWCRRGIYLRREQPPIEGPIEDVLQMYLEDDDNT